MPVPPAVEYWLLVGDSADFGAPTTTWQINQHLTATSLATPAGVSFAAGKTYYAKVKTILDPNSTTTSVWSPTVSFVPGCVPNQPPVARPGGPYSGAPGNWIQFNGSTSSDSDGTIVAYAWTFGDGATGTGAMPAHAYSAAGSYTITLTVTDNQGATASASTTMVVFIPPPGPDPRPRPPVGNVVWTNVAGVSVSGSNLTKTDARGWGNAGAASTTAIASGNGVAEFWVSERNTFRAFGFSHVDADQNFTNIDFAIYLADNGELKIYEKGIGRGLFGTYEVGDRLQIAIEEGVVRYKRNGTAFYSSSRAPVYPLLIDTALFSTGATITEASISGLLVDAAPIETVAWTNAVGVSVSGSSITKTATASGWNAGASSTKAILSGDGFMQFTVDETNAYRALGLSHIDADQDLTTIDFAIYLSGSGELQLYEKGVGRGAYGPYAAGDRFQIVVEGGVVRYQRNGTVFYTSSQRPVYPLLVDTSLCYAGTTIKQVAISGLLPDVVIQACGSFSGDVSSTGTTIFGGQAYAGQGPSNAFDNTTGTFMSLYTSAGTYVGQDFGSFPREIRRVRFGATSSYGFKAMLQYSDDGSSWVNTAVTVSVQPGNQAWIVYDVNPYGLHRYWRFLDLGGYAFLQIDEIEMLVCGSAQCDTFSSDLSSTGTTISGGQKAYPGQGPTNAFDNTTGTFMSLYTSTGTYVGQDFGSTAREVRRVRFGATASYGFNAKLQYSDDRVSWMDTGVVVDVPPYHQSWIDHDVSSYGAHRYWRFLDLGAYGFLQIDEIEMLVCNDSG
jgi:PKD repeat protein